jgi:hypothetical protein
LLGVETGCLLFGPAETKVLLLDDLVYPLNQLLVESSFRSMKSLLAQVFLPI